MRLSKYHIVKRASEKSNRLWIVNEKTGKKFSLLKSEIPVYLDLTPDQSLTKDKLEQAFKEGNVKKEIQADIYRRFYDWSDEEYWKEVFGLDARTKKYFDRIRENIGLVKTEHPREPENLKNAKKVFAHWLEWEIAPLEETYLAQTTYQYSIDDYAVIQLIFRQKPTKKDLSTAVLLADLETEFQIGRLSPIFTCWECGKSDRHFLDIPGSLEEKMEALKDGYCGC